MFDILVCRDACCASLKKHPTSSATTASCVCDTCFWKLYAVIIFTKDGSGGLFKAFSLLGLSSRSGWEILGGISREQLSEQHNSWDAGVNWKELCE